MHGGLFGKQGATLARSMLCIALILVLNGCKTEREWRLNEISGHLPDLQFSLISDTGQTVTDRTCQGYLVMLFFGFTNCQAECPATMFRLAKIVQGLGEKAKRTRIIFVTLDPVRDTPLVMHRYVAAFDAEHALGLTGAEDEIEDIAKRYRVAYRPGKPDSGDIAHSAAVYVFDPQGHARLLITPSDEIVTVMRDLQRLLELSQ